MLISTIKAIVDCIALKARQHCLIAFSTKRHPHFAIFAIKAFFHHIKGIKALPFKLCKRKI